MNTDRLINVVAAVTLVELMLTIGLGATLAEVSSVAKDWRGVLRAFVANYVLVPAAAVGLVLLLGAHPMVAAGVMVVAVCPGAPYAPPFTALAKGRVDRAVGRGRDGHDEKSCRRPPGDQGLPDTVKSNATTVGPNHNGKRRVGGLEIGRTEDVITGKIGRRLHRRRERS